MTAALCVENEHMLQWNASNAYHHYQFLVLLATLLWQKQLQQFWLGNIFTLVAYRPMKASDENPSTLNHLCVIDVMDFIKNCPFQITYNIRSSVQHRPGQCTYQIWMVTYWKYGNVVCSASIYNKIYHHLLFQSSNDEPVPRNSSWIQWQPMLQLTQNITEFETT